ncbi:hypothetical protein HDU99_008108, partial [Rhizoclosmatium hyalinum]
MEYSPRIDPQFTNIVLRPGTHILPSGLAKRTITLTGSDSKRYRVINYFNPSDVPDRLSNAKLINNLLVPSEMVEFQRYKLKVPRHHNEELQGKDA